LGPPRKPSVEMIVDSDDEDMPGLAPACGSDDEDNDKDQDTEEWEESAEEELSKFKYFIL
jgi:hypothetical protein